MTRLYISIVCLTLLGCQSGSRDSYLPGYAGQVGEVIVVMNTSLWDGQTGSEIRSVLEESQYGLPQEEPYFKVIQVTESNFNRVLNTHRNVVWIQVSDTVTKDQFVFNKNTFSKGQMLLRIRAKNSLIANELISKNKAGIISLLQRAELNRIISRNKKFGPKSVEKKINEKFGFKITLQKGFEIVDEKPNSMWVKLERERPLGGFRHQISQNILIAEFPYNSRTDFLDSIILARKDSLTKLCLPGPNEGSYVTTDYEFVPPLITEIGVDEQYAKMLRGLWRMENNFMGGPYVSLITTHPTKDKLIYIEGFVFAPQFNKLEYLRELEAIIKSLKVK